MFPLFLRYSEIKVLYPNRPYMSTNQTKIRNVCKFGITLIPRFYPKVDKIETYHLVPYRSDLLSDVSINFISSSIVLYVTRLSFHFVILFVVYSLLKVWIKSNFMWIKSRNYCNGILFLLYVTRHAYSSFYVEAWKNTENAIYYPE